MKVLLVYAHPEPSSFNAALRDRAARALPEVRISDLYATRFKAVADWDDFAAAGLSKQYGVAQKQASEGAGFAADIRREQESLLWCEALVLQFPLWWFGVPAVLKGWFDRVFAAGFAYDKGGRWFERGPLWPRRAMLAVTTQAPATSFGPRGLNGPIEQILAPVHHTLRFAGFRPVAPFAAFGVMAADDAARKAHVEAYAERLRNLQDATPIAYPSIEEYDATLVRK